MPAVFFPLFKPVRDPRDPNRIVYPLTGILFAGLLLYLCRLGARRRIGELLRAPAGIKKFDALFGVEAFPHGDTLGKLLARLDPDEFQECMDVLVEGLIRKKVLYPHRLLDRWFVVAVDGTGMLSFPERHCPHCLTKTHDGKTHYYHHVLEAKLVTPTGFAFSLMTEFIENPGPDPTKQDCELKAFHRLARRLKGRFPNLPLCLTLDGLYPNGTVFRLLNELGWKFMIVLPDESLPSVNAEFEALARLQEENRLELRRTDTKTTFDYRWVNAISYRDSENRDHQLNVIELRQTVDRGVKGVLATKFKWVANLDLETKNVARIAEQGGRIRWKIENEGFNVQKNGGFGLEHAYAQNWTAAKNFYFILQIAYALFQLMEKGSLLKKIFPRGWGSAKDLAWRLLEAWRNAEFTAKDLARIQAAKFQIRYDSS